MKDQTWGIDKQSFFAFGKKDLGENPNFTSDEEKQIDSLLNFYTPNPLLKQIEKCSAWFYSFLSEKMREKISSAVKKGTKYEVKTNLKSLPSKTIDDLAENFKDLKYQGMASVVLLTHDVDYRKGYDSVLEIAQMEADLGLRASYYFLVQAGYQISGDLLKKLLEMGHEVGVHGLTYDLRLAYRSKSTIVKQLKSAKQKLESLAGQPISGFRNHSLRNSLNMLYAVKAAGFEYESNIYPIKNLNSFNTFFCWPFSYENQDLVEIPVVWPMDTEIFRNLDLPDQEAYDFYREKILLIQNLHGVACLNFHPEIIIDHKEFYQSLINFISKQSFLNLRPKDLAKNYQKKP